MAPSVWVPIPTRAVCGGLARETVPFPVFACASCCCAPLPYIPRVTAIADFSVEGGRGKYRTGYNNWQRTRPCPPARDSRACATRCSRWWATRFRADGRRPGRPAVARPQTTTLRPPWTSWPGTWNGWRPPWTRSTGRSNVWAGPSTKFGWVGARSGFVRPEFKAPNELKGPRWFVGKKSLSCDLWAILHAVFEKKYVKKAFLYKIL